jgi:hypothetical protein
VTRALAPKPAKEAGDRAEARQEADAFTLSHSLC